MVWKMRKVCGNIPQKVGESKFCRFAQPQATTEDSIQQENTQEETTQQQEATETEQQANAE